MLHFPAEITNEFEVVDDINFGFFGVVYKVRRIGNSYLADNKIYAMKTVVKKYGDAKSWKDVETEIKILSELNNPYLLHLERRIDQDNKVYMIIDYCENTDLLKLIVDQIQTGQPFAESEIWKYFIQICFGLECMHSNGYIHRDIKPENILLDKNNNVKIGDFGLSRYLTTSSVGGTPFYYSPEMWRGVLPSKESDIWALGNVLYFLCQLKHPFEGNAYKVQNERHSPIRDYYSNELKYIVDWCMKKEMSERPSINDILSQNFVIEKVNTLGIKIPSLSIVERLMRSNRSSFEEEKSISYNKARKSASPPRNKLIMQSEQLKATRLAGSGDYKSPYDKMILAIVDNFFVYQHTKCPYCGRSFSEYFGNMHIPICAKKAKAEQLKKGGKQPPPRAGKR